MKSTNHKPPEQPTGATFEPLQSLDMASLFTTGFAVLLTMVGVADLSPAVPALAGILILPGLVLSRRVQPRAYLLAWRLAGVLFVPCMVIAHLVTSMPPHHVLVAISLFLCLYRWYNPRGAREHAEIWLASVFLILAAGMDARGPAAIALLAGWFLGSAHLLMRLALWRTRLGMAGPRGRLRADFSPAAAGATWRLLPVLLVLVGLVFVLAPRMQPTSRIAAHPAARQSQRLMRVGFADAIDLQGLTRIRESGGTAFQLIDPPVEMLLQPGRFRVSTLDDFDGWQWRRTVEHGSALNLADGTRRLQIPPVIGSAADAEPPVDRSDKALAIRLVGYPGPALPLPEDTMTVSFAERPESVLMEEDGRVAMPGAAPRDYTVGVATGGARKTRQRLLRGEVLPTHLFVPNSLREEVQHLAWEVQITSGGALSMTPLERAQMASTWLRRNGSYSLEPGIVAEGPEALREFIRRRTGHCELFATTLALLLRQQGIPSRLVSGFSGGEAGSHRDVPALVVQNRHAHAWVEAWIDGEGWVALDPTPAPLVTAPPDFLAARLRSEVADRFTSAANVIEGFDQDRQRRAMAGVSKALETRVGEWQEGAVLRSWFRFRTNIQEPAMALLAAGLLAMNGLAIGLHRRLRTRASGRQAGATVGAAARRAPDLLREILRSLRGDPVRDGETAAEAILRAARDRGLQPEQARELAELYAAWRFGSGDRGAEQELRRMLKDHRAAH